MIGLNVEINFRIFVLIILIKFDILTIIRNFSRISNVAIADV